MNCYNCSAIIDINNLFCDKCGAPQQSLINQILEGSQSAFESLYRYSYQNVYWAVRSMVALDEDTICDLIQNTYLKVYSSISQLKDVAALNGWIKRIAKNVTIDYLRKKEKSKVIFFSDLVSDDADVDEPDFEDESVETNPEISMEYQDRKRLISEILDELPPEQRVVLSMIFMQEMSTKEIAEELGISESTVKSRKAYGKKKVEASVKALEKKGVNLWGLTAVGFFTWLLKGIDVDAAEVPAESILQKLCEETEWKNVPADDVQTESASMDNSPADGILEKDIFAQNAMTGEPSYSAEKIGMKTAVSSVETAGKAVVSKKIIIGVVIMAIVGLGAGTAYQLQKNNRSVEVVENSALVELDTEFVTEGNTENVTGAETQFLTEMQSEQISVPGSESETEQITEQETERIAEPMTEQETERITEPTTERETERITEPTTEQETERTTEQNTEQETEQATESETELIIILGEDLAAETEESVSGSESTVSEGLEELSSHEAILNTIQNLGYEYIGGQQYEVLYQGGDIYTENAGMNQAPPVGVTAYAVDDLDGDGQDELLLVLLEETERVYDTSGLKDSRVTFIVCEEQNGEWTESQKNDSIGITIADFLPCISTYLVPADTGKHIVIDAPTYGSFSADSFDDIFEIIYTEDSLIGTGYGTSYVYWDGSEEDTLVLEYYDRLQAQIESADAELISRIYVDDFYNDQNELVSEIYSRLTNGENIATTLILDDFRTEESSETATEGLAAWKNAYIDYINEWESELDQMAEEEGLNRRSWYQLSYSLIYVDNDDIPELYVGGYMEAMGDRICTIGADNSVVECLLSRCMGSSYVEGSGMLCNSNGNMGYYYLNFYELSNGEFIEMTDSNGMEMVERDADGNESTTYTWNDVGVTEEEFYENWNAIMNLDDLQEPYEVTYSADEIIEMIMEL